jgi:glycosyltransferase involved in cell wall biosynthesis
VIAVSATSARDASAWLAARPERIVIAPHGPGQELKTPATRTAEHFLYVGDDEPRKNVDGLLEAHARYEGTRPLVLAGRAAHKAAAPNLIGIPDPTAEELTDLHARAIALVHPSRDEGFGLTVLEAMSIGTPVIATRNGAIEELAGDAALIVDEADLGDAMRRLEQDEQLRTCLASAGRARAEAFSWKRSARAHIEAYTLARDHR